MNTRISGIASIARVSPLIWKTSSVLTDWLGGSQAVSGHQPDTSICAVRVTSQSVNSSVRVCPLCCCYFSPGPQRFSLSLLSIDNVLDMLNVSSDIVLSWRIHYGVAFITAVHHTDHHKNQSESLLRDHNRDESRPNLVLWFTFGFFTETTEKWWSIALLNTLDI